VNRFTIGLCCPECSGTTFTEVAASTVNQRINVHSSIIVECGRCHRQWQITAKLGAVDTGNTVDLHTDMCGTQRGYGRHRHRNTPVCDRCRQAHAEYERLRTNNLNPQTQTKYA